jgi:hypothetical protein
LYEDVEVLGDWESVLTQGTGEIPEKRVWSAGGEGRGEGILDTTDEMDGVAERDISFPKIEREGDGGCDLVTSEKLLDCQRISSSVTLIYELSINLPLRV